MLSFNIGPIGLPMAILAPLAGLVAAFAAGWLARRKALGGVLMDMALVGGVAARTGFVIRWFEHYRESPLGMLDLRDGGFDLWAGGAGVLAAAAWRAGRDRTIRGALAWALLAGALAWAGTDALLARARQAATTLPKTPLSSIDGQPLAIAGFAQGRPVVINLWASWCPPCVREMPVLEAARRNESGIAFLLVNQGESVAKVRDFLERHRLAADGVALDPGGGLARELGSRALPATLFYDRDGRLAATHHGALSAASLAARLQALREPR